jgi:hypothetical protein
MSGINVIYKELLSVAIELPFYANGRSRKGAIAPLPDISIVPSAETEALFRRIGLIMREVPGGAMILAHTLGETADGDPVMRFPAHKGDKITFLLRLNNPEVLAVNDLPASINTRKLIYLSNTVSDGAAPRNDLHLSQSAQGIFNGSDTLPFVKEVYRFYNDVAVNPAATFVKHLLTGQEIAPVSVINEGSTANLLFDLSSLPGGICELWIANTLKETFYHLAGGNAQPVFGIIEILLDSALEENYRVIEPDRSLTAGRPRYVVRFKSRETLWRYTFALQPNGPLALELSELEPDQKIVFLNQLNIVTNDNNVSFTAYPSGSEEQLVFVTNDAAALREGYFNPGGEALSLSLNKNDAIVKSGLPYPSTRLITAEGTDVYSDIFITI